MSPDKQARLLHLDTLADPEVLRDIFRSAEDDDLLRTALPLVSTMTGTDVAEAAHAVDADELVRLFRAAEEANLVPRMLAMSDRLGAEERSALARIAAAVPAELQDRFAEEVERAGLWPQLFDVAATVPAPDRAGLTGAVRRIAAQRPDLVTELADLAEARGLGDLVAVARSAAGG
jgi:hypothetical protein